MSIFTEIWFQFILMVTRKVVYHFLQCRDSKLSFFWNFGDESTSNLANPIHHYSGTQNSNILIYSDSGIYNVTLSVTNALNITTTSFTTVYTYVAFMIHSSVQEQQDTSGVYRVANERLRVQLSQWN